MTILDVRSPTRPAQRISDQIAARGVDILRVCLGLIIAGFGVLKFFPASAPRSRWSPAQSTC